jgi:DnaA family protein
MKQLALGVKLRTDAVFASFAAGANAQIVAALRRDVSTPIWIWGGPGTGKTHLLQAICAEVGATSAYFPLRRDLALPPEALQGFEVRRVLCVDDTDAVAADLAWETALFGLFNAAGEIGTRLVFAAHAAPRSIAWCLEDWKSRASACEVYQLRELDEQGRIEALTLRAAQRGLELPPETAEYLLRRVPRDLPSLLDLLDALDDASLVAQRRLTIPFIRAAFEKAAETRP